MNIRDNRPASRVVMIFLALVVLGLAVFLTPGNAEGNVRGTAQELCATDGLAISHKCLTQNQKGVNCERLEKVQPAEPVQPIYSRYVGSKTDIGKTKEFTQSDQVAGMHSCPLGSVTR